MKRLLRPALLKVQEVRVILKGPRPTEQLWLVVRLHDSLEDVVVIFCIGVVEGSSFLSALALLLFLTGTAVECLRLLNAILIFLSFGLDLLDRVVVGRRIGLGQFLELGSSLLYRPLSRLAAGPALLHHLRRQVRVGPASLARVFLRSGFALLAR